MSRQIRKHVSRERLLEVLNYEAETGIFTRRIATSPRVKTGDVAGNLTKEGYIRICVDGVLYMAHRLAILYMTGNWPTEFVDHRNGVRSDNRWANLRLATNTENLRNTKRRVDNQSGCKGVSFLASRKKWIVDVRVNGKTKRVGYYETMEMADAAARAYRSQAHGEFANHGEHA